MEALFEFLNNCLSRMGPLATLLVLFSILGASFTYIIIKIAVARVQRLEKQMDGINERLEHTYEALLKIQDARLLDIKEYASRSDRNLEKVSDILSVISKLKIKE